MAFLVPGKILRSKKYRNQVCGSRNRNKFIADKQYYACWETHLWVATV